MTTYSVLNTDGEECQQPYLATADDVWRALEEWLGDMAEGDDIASVYATARNTGAIYYVEPHGFAFVDRFDPIDYLPGAA